MCLRHSSGLGDSIAVHARNHHQALDIDADCGVHCGLHQFRMKLKRCVRHAYRVDDRVHTLGGSSCRPRIGQVGFHHLGMGHLRVRFLQFPSCSAYHSIGNIAALQFFCNKPADSARGAKDRCLFHD